MNALKVRRLNAGKTIVDMADATGISRHTIMRLERASAQDSAPVRAQAPTAKAIADFYGVDASELFTASGEVREFDEAAA